MTTFQDGPAKGQTLMLHRAARFLRVVEEKGKWDALDQIEDTPKPDEKIYAYEITGPPGGCHIRASGGRGGFYVVANYRFVPEQPSEEHLRRTELWGQWCEEYAAKNKSFTAGEE